MNNEVNLTDMYNLFEEIFGCKVVKKRFSYLLKAWGEKRVFQVLCSLVIFPPRELKEGQRDNPYGLVYYIAKTWLKYHDENDFLSLNVTDEFEEVRNVQK